MHVAVLGAGALGRILGVRLATRGKVDVDFVVRAATAAAGAAARMGARAIEIERVGAQGADPGAGRERLRLDAPSFLTEVPPYADVVIVCVRAHELGEELFSTLRRGPSVPIVIVTPMLPHTFSRVNAALPGRARSAVPSVAGYTNASGVTRHWISRSTKMLLDDPRRPEPALSALLSALGRAGIEARFELGAHETGAATAIAVLPLFLAIDAAGSIDALMGDGPLLATMFRAIKEARALAERCGQIVSSTRSLYRFLGPVTVRLGLALGRRRSPELISFVETHFGRASRAQNVALATETLALAEEKATSCDAVRALSARLA